MKYLLLALIVCYGLTYWAYRAADRPGDDFGAAFPLIFLSAVDVILTLIYGGMALWKHTFL